MEYKISRIIPRNEFEESLVEFGEEGAKNFFKRKMITQLLDMLMMESELNFYITQTNGLNQEDIEVHLRAHMVSNEDMKRIRSSVSRLQRDPNIQAPEKRDLSFINTVLVGAFGEDEQVEEPDL